MAWIFGCTLFLSAALLFWVQPLLGKMLLPYLGGSPGVWNICMVFFQALLLAGYGYAHLISRSNHPAWRWIHAALLLAALAFIPFSVTDANLQALNEGANPQAWLLTTLLGAAGLPFFILSSTGPLLQKWFAELPTRHRSDPYFLYAASNAGSFLALLAFPIFLEPNFPLRQQSSIWMAGYGVLALGIILCGWLARSTGAPHSISFASGLAMAAAPETPITWKRRASWIFLAFVPSSLMLGLTHYLGTDIASIPLMWIVPLLLYLLSFILVFGSRNRKRWAERAFPFLAIGVVFLMVIRATQPVWLLVSVHAGFFFIAAVVAHGKLADDRPSPARLTEFYFWMSLGGVLGGIFNALLAPLLFTNIWEYPLGIVAACLIQSARAPASQGITLPQQSFARHRDRLLDLAWPVAIGVLSISLILVLPWLSISDLSLRNLVAGGLPVFCAFLFMKRPIRFGLSLAAIFLAASFWDLSAGQTLFLQRNFFGVSKVVLDPDSNSHRMIHGNTTHGRQFKDPAHQCLPLAYYHRRGPLGTVFDQLASGTNRNVGVIGLGSGSMIAYAQPGDHWTYYEIDPVVLAIAQNRRLFTYLADCNQAASLKFVMGDARLKMRGAPDRHYDLLVLDAFSSDAIPVHLLTREALQLYLSKLKPDGLLAFHISNRYLELRPVVGDLAASAGLACLAWDDDTHSPADIQDGKEQSHWVVMNRSAEILGRLKGRGGWESIPPREGSRAWSDDFSNILKVFKWN